jgi:undecaprenyl-diphosphatase
VKGLKTPEAEPKTVEVRGIASRVVLDHAAGTATKVYRRRLPIWILYWITFQAPFPYATNMAALKAAQYRRRIAGLITKFFFGRDAIAPVVAVRSDGDKFEFVTALVEGGPPTDKHRARQFLRDVTEAFIETGLPTWQVTPHNPRVLGNLLETADGNYWIIDLESNVVTPMLPVRELWSAVRQRHAPPFDDIDLPRLWTFLYGNWDELGERLGEEVREDLVRAVSKYQWYERLWQGTEPRIWSRALSGIAGFLDVPRHVKSLVLRVPGVRSAGHAAEDWLRAGIDRWEEEGRITKVQAQEATAALVESDMLRLLGNLGVHMAISVPLRFPLGAIARFSWTASHRLGAELRALVKRRVDAETRVARSIHTLPVIFAAAMPGVGVASYVLAAPVRRSRILMAVALDQGLRLLPFGLYRRMHMNALTADLANAGNHVPARRTEGWNGAIRAAPARLLAHVDLIAGILLLNAVLLGIAVGGTLYDGGSWFGEPGPVALFAAAQFALAGGLGVLAYVRFWRHRPPASSSAEAARTFFWLSAGAGVLWLAVEDFFHVHHLVSDLVPRLPLIGRPDNPIVIAYAVLALILVRVFWRHLLDSPAQFALLGGAAVFGLATLAVDFLFAEVAPLDEVEDGLHLLTAGLMVCASGVAYRETVTPGAIRSAHFPREEVGAALRAAFRPTHRNVAHWASWAVTLTALLTITLLLMDGDVYGWEVDVTREIQSWDYPQWLFRITSEHLTDPMSHIGAGIFLGISGWLWFSGRRVEAFIVLLIFPLHVLANFPKALVERDRPSDVIDGIAGVGGGKSFPSGHAEYAISFYGFLVFLALLELRLGWQRAALVAAWLAFALLCGVGRIADGRHWPLDVLASYVTGVGLLSGLTWLYVALRPLGVTGRAPARPLPAARPAPRLSTRARAG